MSDDDIRECPHCDKHCWKTNGGPCSVYIHGRDGCDDVCFIEAYYRLLQEKQDREILAGPITVDENLEATKKLWDYLASDEAKARFEATQRAIKNGDKEALLEAMRIKMKNSAPFFNNEHRFEKINRVLNEHTDTINELCQRVIDIEDRFANAKEVLDSTVYHTVDEMFDDMDKDKVIDELIYQRDIAAKATQWAMENEPGTPVPTWVESVQNEWWDEIMDDKAIAEEIESRLNDGKESIAISVEDLQDHISTLDEKAQEHFNMSFAEFADLWRKGEINCMDSNAVHLAMFVIPKDLNPESNEEA